MQFWHSIPQELRALPQWCFTYPADPDPKRRKAPRKRGGYLASDTNPQDWMTFEEACQNAMQCNGHIGFMLSETDPYACIDLDVVDQETQTAKGVTVDPTLWTTQEQLNRFWAIAQAMTSYAERSVGGKGMHIWVKGAIGRGCKRDGVEVYSQERFIICTGQPVMNLPIIDRQNLLQQMVAEMRKHQQRQRAELVEVEQELEDFEVMDLAINAENSDKFNTLCSMRANCDHTGEPGDWHILGYKSQSEADLALMSIFTFYSKSNEQCRRLFRMTGLGKRAKSMADDRHLNLMLSMIRGRQAEQEAVEAEEIERAAAMAMRMMHEAKMREDAKKTTILHAPGAVEPVVLEQPVSAAVVNAGPSVHVEDDGEGLSWPPGMVGKIAQFVYQSSPRPAKEISIATAIAVMAGICGKAFGFTNSGLNMYLTLIARSGVGKEAMHSGASNVIQAIASRQPPAARFVDFTRYASGPALSKAVAANPCFVNIVGEWGRRLERMAMEGGRDTVNQELRTVMTDLYQKSGGNSVVGGIGYSNKEGNVASVTGVAYSMIGESTPDTFYRALTPAMMEDGFLSRFLIIEYTGKRPKLNLNQISEPDKALGDALAELATHAMTVTDRGERVPVQRTGEAAKLIADFEAECDERIDATDLEMYRQMWNRASLKVMRLSSLLAVGDNWISPCVTAEHVQWALDCVRKDIRTMNRRIQDGDVGHADDSNRMLKISQVLRGYMEGHYEGTNLALQAKGIIRRSDIYNRVRNLTHFKGTGKGPSSSQLLDSALRSMVDNGQLREMDKGKMEREFGVSGRTFRIISLEG
ncbi:hypothetical protein [Pseudomonas virus PBPA162]|uniref:Primase/helicase n=1 Tax=Pseudomonas virus PBPA162 TaxID=2588096 RepID=A0A4Y5TQP4_9CAUD|nr:hypothetical protein PQC32_gp76 [Pseudomonas virus PBPA162]QDB70910.1 hypothetical protein [Pseudomonas virus PBPA162]